MFLTIKKSALFSSGQIHLTAITPLFFPLLKRQNFPHLKIVITPRAKRPTSCCVLKIREKFGELLGDAIKKKTRYALRETC